MQKPKEGSSLSEYIEQFVGLSSLMVGVLDIGAGVHGSNPDRLQGFFFRPKTSHPELSDQVLTLMGPYSAWLQAVVQCIS